MVTLSSKITEYFQRFRHGDRDGAFFGLLEMGHDILPELMAMFKIEPDDRIRAFLVEVIWQHRQHSVIPFLGEALNDSESQVWRQALDGLVTLASPAALKVLRSASVRQFPHQQDTEQFRSWLEEAIGQAEQSQKT